MWTGHLSRFIPAQPPGPYLQKLNAWVHQEPINTIVHGVYWSMVFVAGAPFIGMMILWSTFFEAMFWCIGKVVPKSSIWSTTSTVMEEVQRQNDSNSITDSSPIIELCVVITGCDTGFGKDLACRLAEKGFIVFAGCLQESSMTTFTTNNDKCTKDKKSPQEVEKKIHPLLLDVTKDDQVEKAATSVQDWLSYSSSTRERYLHALANNAGIGKIGYIDWLKLDDFQQCMDVNCFGQIRMVKAFLPIFKQQAVEIQQRKRQAKSYNQCSFYSPKIMNVISMAGTARGGLALCPYETSKTAAEVFTDGLRLEMKLWGVHVIAINPSFHTTPLTTNINKRMYDMLWNPLPENLKKEYGQDCFDRYAQHVNTLMSQQWDPIVTIDIMVESILSRHPASPSRINVGMDSKYGLVLYSMYPAWLRNIINQILMPDQTPAVLTNNAKPQREESRTSTSSDPKKNE